MKTRRTLAALLCVMMVLSMLPAMQVFATGTSWDTVADVVGKEVTPKYDSTFAEGFTPPAGIFMRDPAPSNFSYSNENGLELGVTGAMSASYRYSEGSNTTPMAYEAVVFSAKVPAGGKLNFQASHPEFQTDSTHPNSRKAYFDITPEGVSISGAGDVTTELVPGNEWIDYLVMTNNQGGYSVYAKHETKTSGKWVLLKATTAWYSGGAGQGLHLQGSGSGAYVKSVQIYREGTAGGDSEGGGDTGDGGSTGDVVTSHDTLNGAVGKSVVPKYDLQASSSIELPDGIKLHTTTKNYKYTDANGVEISSGGEWCPTEGSGTTPLSYAAVVFGAKVPEGGSLSVKASHPEFANGINARKAVITINPSGVGVSGTGNYTTSLTPGNEWVDYLVMANNQGGYSVYARQETLTGGKWNLIKATTAWDGQVNQGAGQGLHMNATGSGAYVSYVTIYEASAATGGNTGIGTAKTLEEIVEGETESLQELKLTEGEMRNLATGAVTGSQPVVGTDGLEVKNTAAGQALVWGYGAEEAWNPLSATTPVRFRAKLEAGSSLEVQMNGRPNAEISLTPEKVVLQGLRPTEAPSFQPGTDWVNYLVTAEGSNFHLYAQRDGETKWTLIAVSERFQPGGYFGLSLRNTASAAAYVESIEQYKVVKPILTDAATLASASNTVYLDEAFLSADGEWSLTGSTITEGVLTGAGSASYDLSNINIPGVWYLSARVRITGADGVSGVIHNDGSKAEWSFKADGFTVGGSQNTTKVDLNQWYDLLFAFDGKGKVDVYRRSVGENKVIKTHTGIGLTSEAGDSMSITIASGSVDSVRIYAGDYFGMESMTISNGSYQVKGEYFPGTIESAYDRRGTMVAVAYNKEYGYVTFAKAIPYSRVESGYGVDLTHTFAKAGLTADGDIPAVMMWDALESGIPLGDVAGLAAANTADSKPMTGQPPELKVTEKFNEVEISGYAGVAGGKVTASLVDGNGELVAAAQSTANAEGMVKMGLALDPASATGTYTLRYQYGTGATTSKPVTLYGKEIPYNTINSASAMYSFINTYGGENAKNWNEQEGFAAEVYDRFLAEKGTTESFANLYEFRKAMDVALDEEMEERELCANINTAVASGKWTDVRDYLYASDLGITAADIAGIDNPKELFLRLGSSYTSEAAILADFQSAVIAQKAAEGGGTLGVAGGNFGGTTGGGGFGGGAASIDTESLPENQFAPELDAKQKFTDLDSVAWAKESIEKLQMMGVVSGDGDGSFAPNRTVTREEFLKMAMQAAGISGSGDAAMGFADVEQDAWYYEYVATAYQAGIIQGMSEEYFGIGQQITRADMAVMLHRILDYSQIVAESIRASIVFDDFNTIPEYARKSVLNLYEAGLMNGMGENLFAGDASATRAEAATAIYRIYQYLDERR